MKKLLYTLLAVSIIFSSCSEKRDKLTVLKDDMIGKNIKELYGKKKILMGISDQENYHIYYVNDNCTVKSNKNSGKIVDVCIGKKCFPKEEIVLKPKKEKKPYTIGIWRCEDADLESNIKIFIKNKVYYYSMTFDKDGSVYTKELKKINGRRYEIVAKDDYIILKEDEATTNYDIGDLEFWDKQGLFTTCQKIN
tara:strand:+ start:134 stop:715 length:582 start_codon:yes stop_codon:yes gene_type:complete